MCNVEFLLTRFQNSNIDEGAVNDLMCCLINNYVLKVNDDIYDFCEIELYYKSRIHNDCGVLKREKKAGDIFFHRYGMDICFNSNGTDEYGGILIRSLKKDDKYILGSWDCSYTLLNKYHSKICISIEKKEAEKTQEVCKTTRIKSECKNNIYNASLFRYITIQACQDIQTSEEQKYKRYWQKIKEKTQHWEKIQVKTQQCCKDNND